MTSQANKAAGYFEGWILYFLRNGNLGGTLRITFLTNRDLASNFALNLLVPSLSESHELRVFCSDTVGGKPLEPTLSELTFYEQTLPNELLFPLIDAQRSTGELLTFQGLGDYLSSAVASLNEPNTPRGHATLAANAPDLIVSVRYGRILEVPTISIASKGALNLHSGKLPDYRGVMTTCRAMLAGDAELCSTLHWIDDTGIDTGPIISIQATHRNPAQCYLANTLGLYPSGCAALLDAIDTISTGGSLPVIPSDAPAQYYSFPDAPTIAAFQAASFRWVDTVFLTRFIRRYLPKELTPILP